MGRLRINKICLRHPERSNRRKKAFIIPKIKDTWRNCCEEPCVSLNPQVVAIVEEA